MITKDNLTIEYPKYQHLFTDGMNEAFPEISANIDLYGHDKEIDEVIDDFIGKCNRMIANHEPPKPRSAAKEKKTSKKAPAPKKEISQFIKMTKSIADTIYEQLGGRQFIAMTGAKNFRTGDDEMYFNFGRNKTASNTLGIKLGADDTYYLTFYKGNKVMKEFDMVYCDQLQDIFEDYTGLYVTMHSRTSNNYGTSTDEDDDQSIRYEPESLEPSAKEDEQIKPSTKKAPIKKTSAKSKKSEKADVPTVEQMPAEIALLKSFYNMHGVVKTKAKVYLIIKKLQKAITDKAVRKTSPHASQIEYMQKHLIAFYNDMKSGQKTYEIPANKLAELKKIIDVKLADHVVIIRAFINILNDTKTGLMEKAKALHKKIVNATFPDLAKPSITAITKSLSDYISGTTDTVKINEFDLQGLYGLAGLSGLGELPPSTTTIEKPIPASELIKMHFKTLKLSGRWEQLIGEPTDPFYIMIWGNKGKGKSTLAIEFAKYLNTAFRKRILYVASEEGVGGVLQSKFIRLNAGMQNIHVVNALPPNLVEYDCIFIDSVNTMNIKVEEIERIKKMYPYLSIVLMFQSRRDGEFKGNNSFPHLVDAVIECSDNKASCPEKNRYGGKGTIDIVFEERPKTERSLKGWIM